MGNQPYHDGDLPLAEVVSHLGDGVSTSSPPPGRITKALEDRLADGDAAVALTVARRMSSTFDAARLAAKTVDGDVRVMDTETAAGAEGLVVLEAASVRGGRRRRRRGGTGGPLGDRPGPARRHRRHARPSRRRRPGSRGRGPGRAIPQRAAPLRVPSRAGHVHCGPRSRVTPRSTASSGSGAGPSSPVRHCTSLCCTVTTPSGPRRCSTACEPRWSRRAAFVAEFSTVMIAHTGPDLVGLAWWWKPEAADQTAGDASSAQSTASATGSSAGGENA